MAVTTESDQLVFKTAERACVRTWGRLRGDLSLTLYAVIKLGPDATLS